MTNLKKNNEFQRAEKPSGYTGIFAAQAIENHLQIWCCRCTVSPSVLSTLSLLDSDKEEINGYSFLFLGLSLTSPSLELKCHYHVILY